ncbi:acyl-CoA dehydrogenase family protein [Sphingomonas immobilis]|uniref:Acyl-CoA dehydrogenase family protein n=1 Tax=Sphingomonas immobilis TaxID=3063997 RepID=A0ABT8ZXG6_9SPHN|nr:acyl-CoA dehydrogenase family protein [Sphingomonas sp. CA1-15]MDO7842265.1 acyl-CoA dehydrogenase family protein [Sphingomonas sp. CA1-15]
MDMELTGEQRLLVEAVEALGSRWQAMPPGHERDYAHYEANLQGALAEGGFLRAGLDMGMLEAALVAIEVSRLPVVTSVGASALVAAVLTGDVPDGPLAIVGGDWRKAQRMLPVATHALALHGERALLLDLAGVAVAPVASVYAYPYGRFAAEPDWSAATDIGDAATLRQWARVAIACEAAGAAESAVAVTVAHVKERFAFGRAIGSYQAVQHRLAQCHQIARAMRFLALHAAWSGEATAADIAATYAQDHVNKLAFDLHQFSGGMGVTCEYQLHFFSYRLRALQGELGGADGAASGVYDRLWGAAA